MDRVTDILIRFARARIKALESIKRCSQAHYVAARRIENVAGYFESKPSKFHWRATLQLEPDLMLLLPGTESRFTKLRQKILDLIHQSKVHYESMEKRTST